MEQYGPETALWRAVISQAVSDATAIWRPRKGMANGKPMEMATKAKRERDEARDWLLKGGKDFQRVCHMAGLEPTAVQREARMLAAKDWAVTKPARLDETVTV
jgi:hypothetical protein